MVLHFVRAVFLLTVLALVFSIATNPLDFPSSQWLSRENLVALYMVIPFVLAVVVTLADVFWRKKNLQAIGGMFFGLLAGLALAYVLGQVFNLVAEVFRIPADAPMTKVFRVMIGSVVVYLSVSYILQTKDDFRFIIPYVEFSKQTKGTRPLLLDTSVVIDGRVADIADTRILEGQLIVPRFVLAELQAIADSPDKLRRNRGRRGLDILDRLRRNDKIEITILDSRPADEENGGDVDTKLVGLAKTLGGKVMTNDYNLNKIAQLRGVEVININDLASALRPVVLPGEGLSVKIIKPGEEVGQGVGYLDDGTMVVVEQGREHVGEDVTITVTSVLQTSAGRMVFGRPEGAAPGPRGRGR